MLRDHRDAVVADLRRYYGVRLDWLHSGELTFVELAALVRNLPVGSATWAALNNFPIGWSLTDILLADVFHALTGNPHPARPQGEGTARSAHEETVRRLVEQRERLAQGARESTMEG